MAEAIAIVFIVLGFILVGVYIVGEVKYLRGEK